MRIRLPAVSRHARYAALVLPLAFLAVQAAVAQQTPPSGGGSPVTDQILKELRKGKPGGDTTPPAGSQAPGMGAAPADPAAPAAPGLPAPPTAPGTDGSLADPVPDVSVPDGQLKDQPPAAPIPLPSDGDLAAEGKQGPAAPPADLPTAIPEPITPQTAPASSPPAFPVRTRPKTTSVSAPMEQRDARSVAGRKRKVAADAPPPRRPKIRKSPVPDDAGTDIVIQDVSQEAYPEDSPAARDETSIRSAPDLRRDIVELDESPYTANGIRLGGFVLKPTVSAETVFTNNVLRTATDPKRDVSLQLRPGVTLESAWSRHFVSVDVHGLVSRHNHAKSEDEKQLNASAFGRLDVTDRTTLEAEVGYDFGQVARSNPTLPVGTALRPSTHTAMVGGAIEQRFNRLDLRLHGSAADTHQGDAGEGGSHYRDTQVDGRVGYELSPRLTVFGTAKRINRRFADASGTDSSGNDLRLGIESDHSEKLSLSATIGGAKVTSVDDALPEASGFVADANIIWLPSALSTLAFNASTDLGLTDVSGASAVRTQKISIDMRHELRRWLALTAGFQQIKRSYEGLALEESERTGRAGVEYSLNRNWAVTGNYQHTNFDSTTKARSYDEDQVTVGLRLQK